MNYIPDKNDSGNQLIQSMIENNSSESSVIDRPTMSDKVNPNHYKKGKVECIDAIEAATVGKHGVEAVCVANIIKYLWRYEEKEGAVDVEKAKWYLNKLLTHLNEK